MKKQLGVLVFAAHMCLASGPTGVVDGINMGFALLCRAISQTVRACNKRPDIAITNRFTPIADSVNFADAMFVGSHNAYASKSRWSCFYQHEYDIAVQLQLGVRVFLLDTYLYQDTVVPSHRTPESWYVNLQQGTFGTGSYERLADVMAQFVNFLRTNPDEVICVSFENYVPIDQLATDIAQVPGIDEVLFKSTDWSIDESLHIWPTLGWMRKNSKRLLLFVPYVGAQSPLLWDYATYIVQNQCCTVNVHQQAQQSAKSAAQDIVYKTTLGYDPRMLFFFNNFGRITRTFGQAQYDNSYDRLQQLCSSITLNERTPNVCILDCVVETSCAVDTTAHKDVFDLINLSNGIAAYDIVLRA